MKKQNASKSKTQIFVPRGTVSSTEDTVIEIPPNLLGKPMIIAKKKESQKSIKSDDKERKGDYSHSSYSSSGQR